MNFDIGIIGVGVAGAFATLKLAENKDIKIAVFDLGRPPLKRRRQIEGYLGCLPNSDGKLYTSNLTQVTQLTGIRRAKSSYKYFNKILSNINTFELVKDQLPSAIVKEKLEANNYSISANDYYQMYPKDIHALSKYMVNKLESNTNITYYFDEELYNVTKENNEFVIKGEAEEYRCKKIIFCAGRSGWRWATQLYKQFGIIKNNDIAKFGIRIEVDETVFKDFNNSTCSLINNDIEIGPFNWQGTIIPEDHIDMANSAFRSNENRWKTNKVSFCLIGNKKYSKAGFEQTDRLGKLTFVLTNDRISKEKISALFADKSKISVMCEYNWLKEEINKFAIIVPEIISKGYFHVPTIKPLVPKIKLKKDLESEIEGMYIAGESSGIMGIISAACTGIICADSIQK